MSLITHQMAFEVRYVKVEESEAQIKESFLNFLPLHGKRSKKLLVLFSMSVMKTTWM